MNNFIVKPNKTVSELIDISKGNNYKMSNHKATKEWLRLTQGHSPFSLRQAVDAIKSQQVPTPSESEYKDYLSFIDQ
jgi:hypothetical protein